MDERVTKAEAARVIEVNRSTVTRWCNKHPALVDEDGKVSIEELARHRDTVINPALQTRKGKGKEEAAPKASGPSAEGAPAETAPATAPDSGPNLNLHRARSEEIKAFTAELDLADRLGRTVERSRVEAAAAEAAELIKATAAQLVRDRAEPISRLEDVREVELALGEMMDELLQKAAKALAGAAGGDDGAERTAA